MEKRSDPGPLRHNKLTIRVSDEELAAIRNYFERSNFAGLAEYLRATPRSLAVPEHLWADVSDRYMRGIGLGEQPYLVYRHEDTAHPHIHIVSNIIRPNGERINVFGNVKHQSETLRRQLEAEYTPSVLSQKPQRQPYGLFDHPQRLTYGETALSTKMRDVVDHVAKNYHHTTLDEYNGILRGYNIWARPVGLTAGGRPKGLVYQALRSDSQYIGKPIPASFFESKPTWENLRRQWAMNVFEDEERSRDMVNRMKFIQYQRPADLETYIRGLKKEHIGMIAIPRKDGAEPNLIFVDHHAKLAVESRRLKEKVDTERFRQELEERIQARQYKIAIPQKVDQILDISWELKQPQRQKTIKRSLHL